MNTREKETILRIAKEMGAEQNSARYNYLVEKGIPVGVAALLAIHRNPSGFILPNLDKLVEEYTTVREKLPETAAVIVATSKGRFSYIINGLDQVVKRYEEGVKEGLSEIDAIKRAIF